MRKKLVQFIIQKDIQKFGLGFVEFDIRRAKSFIKSVFFISACVGDLDAMPAVVKE